MKASIRLRTLATGVGAALALMAASSANALVTDGSASAYALDADLPLGLGIGPIPLSSVSGNDSTSDSVLSATVDPFLSTGVLNSSAMSNVDGSSGSKSASSSSSILDFDLNLPAVLGLSFDVLSSNSSVDGDAGSFDATGNSSIVNLQGSGLLAGLGLVVLDGSANQQLLSAPGISVIANRQTESCSSFSCSITTDALFVSVANLTTLTLGSSTAQLAGETAPIPEPSTYAMMVAGLLGIGAMRKWRGRSAA